jgi:hypothetical protein
MAESRKTIEAELRGNFRAFLRSQGSPMTPLWDALNMLKAREWVAFSFGGIPRGVLDTGAKYNPRDLDLVFDDKDFLHFEKAFAPMIRRRNSYGGLKLIFNGLAIDAWPLSSTWAFRTKIIKDVSFKSLPKTTFLNIDGIIVEVNPRDKKPRRIYESGFYDGWIQNVLDINMVENPHPEICFARTLQISRRFGFRVSQRLAIYLWETFNKTPILKLQEAQHRHYGRIQISGNELLEVYRGLKHGLNSSTMLPIQIFPSRRNQMELAFGVQNHP